MILTNSTFILKFHQKINEKLIKHGPKNVNLMTHRAEKNTKTESKSRFVIRFATFFFF